MRDESYVAKRLEMVERELAGLRRLLIAGGPQKKRKGKTLRGIWKGVEFTDKEIDDAKRSIFREL